VRKTARFQTTSCISRLRGVRAYVLITVRPSLLRFMNCDPLKMITLTWRSLVAAAFTRRRKRAADGHRRFRERPTFVLIAGRCNISSARGYHEISRVRFPSPISTGFPVPSPVSLDPRAILPAIRLGTSSERVCKGVG